MLGEDLFIMDNVGQMMYDAEEKYRNSKEYKQEMKDKDIREAKKTILELKTILLYLEDNDYAVEVYAGGVKVGLCINKNMIPVIEAEIKEVEKFLKGEENEWE